MGGLNTALSIGIQALNASETALETTSNNIANANTAGYTEEVPQLSENALTQNGNQVSGGGVTLDSIQSLRDELLNLQIQQQTSAQSSASTESSNLQQVQTYFSSTGNDIASEFTKFASSLTALSANPSNSAAQQGVISAGQDLAQSFNTTANGLVSIQSEADQQVTQTVSQINTLTSQISQLNSQLAQSGDASNGSNGGTIEDQRDNLVQQLSNLTGITVTQSSDGEDTITTANGSPLVVGGQSFDLSTATGSNGFQQVTDANGTDITSAIQGGVLGGAIQTRDQDIPGFLSSLNTLASQFATAFNSAQATGYDSNGNAGQDFFTVPSDSSEAAAGITVSITDPSEIAVSSDAASGGGNGNVANLSAALTSTLPSGQTAEGSYASLVSEVGTATSNSSTQASAIGSNLLQLTNQQNSMSGVSVDDETANLIRYQTAYEAAARIVSTIQQLSVDTLDMGSDQSY